MDHDIVHLDCIMRTQKKKLLQRLFSKKMFMVYAAVAVFVIGSGLINMMVRDQSIEADIERLNEKADKLETRNLEIVELTKRFSTEGFLEREARLKLNLQMPGEKMVIIEHGEPVESVSAPTSNEVENITNRTRWWRYFFDQERLNTN